MKQFPIIRAEGTHYEIGKTVGIARRQSIKQLFKRNISLYPEYFSKHKKEAAELTLLTKRYLPQYIEELQGVADGSGINLDGLFLSNSHEISYFSDNPASEHCTIIAVPTENGYIIGHNEDWDDMAIEHLYILDAKINGNRIFGLGYDFTNTIIGDSIAINQYGLIQAINDVSHRDKQAGVPRGFIARAILDSRTLEEAENLLNNIPRRSGFNHFLVQGNRLWNIETTAKQFVTEKFTGKKFVHTNHYLTRLRFMENNNKESEARFAKVFRKLPMINDVEDTKKILSDSTDPQICRPGTIASLIFDSVHKTAFISYGQPNPENYTVYHLNKLLS